MTEKSVESRLADLQTQCFDQDSELYIENLLDLASSITYDINTCGQLKESKPLKLFTERFQSISDNIKNSRISVDDFKVIKTIGQGGFGRVDLVKHKKNNSVYAMKIMEKSTYIQNNFNGFWEERDILVKNNSDWLVKCFYTFFDLKKLYIVMEYMPGGDLYRWLSELEEFNEEQTNFFGMEIVLALEHLHKLDFLHRDLKPENMLLDKYGHLKLADFGTCIKSFKGKIKTNFQCGTPDYIAPEILKKAGTADLEVGCEIDWWAFGIILYELYYGETPWEGETASSVYCNIMNYAKTLKYPNDKPASNEYLSLLNGILTDSSKRFTVDQIKSHPFFTNSKYPWKFSNIKNFPVPIESFNVTSDDDTKYIDFEPNQKNNNFSLGSKNNYFTGENLAFAGFTFNRYHKYYGTSKPIVSSASYVDEAKIKELNVEIKELINKLEETETTLKFSSSKVNELQKVINEKDQIIIEQTDELESTIEKLNQFIIKTNSLQSSIEILENEKNRHKSLIDDKESKLKDLNEKLTEYESNIDNLNNKKDEYELKMNKLYNDLTNKDCEYQKLKNIQSMLLEAEEKVQVLNKELNEYKRLLNETESKKKMLEDVVDELRNSRVKAADEELESLRNKYETNLNEKQNIESKLQSIETYLTQTENEKSELSTHLSTEKLKYKNLTDYNTRLENEIKKKDELLNDMKKRLNKSEDDNKILKQNLTKITREKNSLENGKKSYDDLKELYLNELEHLKEYNEEILEKISLNEKDYRNKIEEKKKEINDYRQNLDNINKELIQIKKEKSEVEKSKIIEIEEIKTTMKKELDKKVNELNDIIAQYDTELTQSKQRYDNLEKENNVTKEKLKAAVDKIEGIMENKAVANNLFPKQTRAKRNKNSSADVTRKLKQLEVDHDKLKSQLQAEIQKNNVLNGKVQNSLQDLQQKQDQIKEKDKLIEALKSQLEFQKNQKLNLSTDEEKILLQSSLTNIYIVEQGKNRKKPKVVLYTLLLEPYKIKFTKVDQISTSLENIIELDLKNIEVIRRATAADFRNDKVPVDNVLQIAYIMEDDAQSTNSFNDTSSIGMGSLDHNFNDRKSITGTMDSRISVMLVDNQTTFVSYKGHKFMTIHLRRGANCDVCEQTCSDLFNPPAIYECERCKIRCHQYHVSERDTNSNVPVQKIHQCKSSSKWIYLKFDDSKMCDLILNKIKKLKSHEIALQCK